MVSIKLLGGGGGFDTLLSIQILQTAGREWRQFIAKLLRETVTVCSWPSEQTDGGTAGEQTQTTG